MVKKHANMRLEEEAITTLARIGDTLTRLNGGKKVSKAVVVELITSMISDPEFTVDGMNLEPLVVGYYTTRFNRQDGRKKDE